MERHESHGLAYYTSELLDKAGIAHGFFTRLGGESPKPFATLNVHRGIGDSDGIVYENRRRICKTLGFDSGRLVFANELGHDARVKLVDQNHAGKDLDSFDALITKTKKLPIALSVADCVPIIIADKQGSEVAVVHVSWRSLVAGIIENTVNQLEANSGDLVAALGPAIGPDSYEVKQDFIEAVSPKFSKLVIERAAKHFFDLPAAAENELKQLGIQQIDNLGINTYTHTNEFYSYRKEGKTGRFAAIAAL